MLNMHRDVELTKSELIDILDGRVIEKVDVDGILNRIIISNSNEEKRCFKVYFDLHDKRTNKKITSSSQIVRAKTVEDAVNEIKQKHLYETLSITIAVNKIEERRL